MQHEQPLSDDQERRIAATLTRIRQGLNTQQGNPQEEPAHIFEPEAPYAQDK